MDSLQPICSLLEQRNMLTEKYIDNLVYSIFQLKTLGTPENIDYNMLIISDVKNEISNSIIDIKLHLAKAQEQMELLSTQTEKSIKQKQMLGLVGDHMSLLTILNKGLQENEIDVGELKIIIEAISDLSNKLLNILPAHVHISIKTENKSDHSNYMLSFAILNSSPLTQEQIYEIIKEMDSIVKSKITQDPETELITHTKYLTHEGNKNLNELIFNEQRDYKEYTLQCLDTIKDSVLPSTLKPSDINNLEEDDDLKEDEIEAERTIKRRRITPDEKDEQME